MPPLRFLADESCDFAVVRALRAAGYDVIAVGEIQQRSVDRELIRDAVRDERILLTEDKDFGWLVFASDEASPGVIFIRYPGNAREALARHVGQVVAEHSETLHNAFVVIQPGHVRISRKPGHT
jgi:predicted nuclease of predicted toxin-antitoxin system